MEADLQAQVNARLRLFSWLAAIAGFVVLLLVAIFMAVVLILALRVQDAAQTVELQAQQSHDAICAVMDNTTGQIRRTTSYLAEHPEGATDKSGAVVIPASLIEAGLAEDRALLDALRDNVFCGGGS